MSLTVVFLLTACVPKPRYDALVTELASAQAAHAALSAAQTETVGRVTTLAEALKQAESARDTLADQVEALTRQLASEIERLNAEKASLVKDRSSLRASVDEMQAALTDLSARRSAAEARVREYQDLLARFQKLIDAGQLRVKVVDGKMVVELATDILFGSGKADLSPEGAKSIAVVAAVLATLKDRQFQVEGHTDNVPIHTDRFPSNWELASARAIGVVNALVKGGLPANRASAASFADTHPAQPNDTDAHKAANRRIEIVLVPDLADLPGFGELQKLGGG